MIYAQRVLRTVSREQTYLSADPRGGLTQRQYGDVLGSVQPVDGQFGGGGPFHHGHVVLTEKTQKTDSEVGSVHKDLCLWRMRK